MTQEVRPQAGVGLYIDRGERRNVCGGKGRCRMRRTEHGGGILSWRVIVSEGSVVVT